MYNVIKVTSKGQVTLPVKWRKNFSTDRFLMKEKGNTLVISPVDVGDLDEEEWETIFDATEHNQGKGVSIDEMIQALTNSLESWVSMNEIEKLLQRVSREDKERLLATMAALRRGDLAGMHIKKLVDASLYRVRVGRFRIQYSIHPETKMISIMSVRRRNEGTYS